MKRPAKKRVGRSEEPQQQEPQPVPGVVEHPRVVFKTVTQQPELPKEALMVPGKKPFVPGSVPPSMLTKPILPMRGRSMLWFLQLLLVKLDPPSPLPL